MKKDRLTSGSRPFRPRKQRPEPHARLGHRASANLITLHQTVDRQTGIVRDCGRALPAGPKPPCLGLPAAGGTPPFLRAWAARPVEGPPEVEGRGSSFIRRRLLDVPARAPWHGCGYKLAQEVPAHAAERTSRNHGEPPGLPAVHHRPHACPPRPGRLAERRDRHAPPQPEPCWEKAARLGSNKKNRGIEKDGAEPRGPPRLPFKSPTRCVGGADRTTNGRAGPTERPPRGRRAMPPFGSEREKELAAAEPSSRFRRGRSQTHQPRPRKELRLRPAHPPRRAPGSNHGTVHRTELVRNARDHPPARVPTIAVATHARRALMETGVDDPDLPAAARAAGRRRSALKVLPPNRTIAPGALTWT